MRLLTPLTVIATVLFVVSCAPQTIDTFCLKYQPVTYSAAGDTEDTKRQIKANNAVWVSDCK